MAKPAPKPRAELKPEDDLALVVATGWARQATMALACCEHPHPSTRRADFQHLCNAEACLDGALEIVRAHKDKMKETL